MDSKQGAPVTGRADAGEAGQTTSPPHIHSPIEPTPHTLGNDPRPDTEDTDSAIGDDTDDSTFTASVTSSIMNYRQENGRTYHAYKDGQYYYPNDETEQDRLDLQHHLFLVMMDGKLFCAPLGKNIQDVLDIGTGTGLWAIDFADEHPSSTVIGTDLSPIQPSFVPPNLSFLIDDASAEWKYRQQFDFIHARELHCAVEEKKLMEQALTNLKPGGWLELQELAFPTRADDESLQPDMAIYKWSALMMEASIKMGQPLDNAEKYHQWMEEAGFVNVQTVLYKWPSNSWPKAKKDKEVGAWNMHNTLDGLQAFTLGLFTRVLGWTQHEVEVFLVDVRKDVVNRKIHNYWPIHIVFGQKPE